MEQPGLDGRHRDKNGEISRKHGNTRVSTLRTIYGPGFASGVAPHTTLAELLSEAHARSLSDFHRQQLHRDHDEGALETKIARVP